MVLVGLVKLPSLLLNNRTVIKHLILHSGASYDSVCQCIHLFSVSYHYLHSLLLHCFIFNIGTSTPTPQLSKKINQDGDDQNNKPVFQKCSAIND